MWHRRHHWAQEYACILFTTRKTTWNHLLSWRHFPGIEQVSIFWLFVRTIWLSQSLWVRIDDYEKRVFMVFTTVPSCHSDFFPVIFGFLRRLPIIGPILSNPNVSRVSLEERL